MRMKTTANTTSSVRRRTSFTADPALLAEAKALGVNVSRAAEAGIEMEVKKARWEKWRAENQAAIESWNEHTRKNGLPMAQHRPA